MQPFDIGPAPVIKATAVCKGHHLLMRAGEKHTDGTGLVLADLPLKSGGLNTVLNSLSTVNNALRKVYKFTVEVCSALVSVVGNVRFILGGLALDVAGHSRIVACATLQVAHCILCCHIILN